MKSHPILFNATMVRAILDGRKTQTRRIIKPQPDAVEIHHGYPVIRCFSNPKRFKGCKSGWSIGCPGPFNAPGQPGDRLWVRESFSNLALPSYPEVFVYRADGTHSDGDGVGCSLPDGCRWMPSIHMPRRASRITLEITDVRVERLNGISITDAISEGVSYKDSDGKDYYPPTDPESAGFAPRYAYQSLWESIYGDESWNDNPWVWVVGFRRVQNDKGQPTGGQPK